MKSNADIWDCKDATLEIVDGKGMITNTDDRTGNINSKVITLDSSKHVFGNAGRGDIRKMESNLLVPEEKGKESKVTVRYDNSLIGVQRFNLSYAMMTWYPEWQGIHRCKLDIYVWRQKWDKVVLNYVKVEQTDKEALDTNDSPIHYRPPVGQGNLGISNHFSGMASITCCTC